MSAVHRACTDWLTFGPLVMLPMMVTFLSPADLPPWAFMWMIAFALYAVLKWMTCCDARSVNAPAWKRLGYLLAWPGMDARTFLGDRSLVHGPSQAEWLAAGAKLVCGAACIWWVAPWLGQRNELLFGWVAMVGLVLFLHCGLFHLLSCAWRCSGVNARPLMNSPLMAKGVAEFWGRRWNSAFRDLTHRFVFQPLTRRHGPSVALLTGFVVSGLIHELAITLPARSGFGGPTMFFAIQSAWVFVERSAWGKGFGLGRGLRGWVFTTVTLLAPLRLLFPNAFVTVIIVPFCRVLGAR